MLLGVCIFGFLFSIGLGYFASSSVYSVVHEGENGCFLCLCPVIAGFYITLLSIFDPLTPFFSLLGFWLGMQIEEAQE